MNYENADRFINEISGFFDGTVMPQVEAAEVYFTAENMKLMHGSSDDELQRDLDDCEAKDWDEIAERAEVLIQRWEDNRADEIIGMMSSRDVDTGNDGAGQFIFQCVKDRNADEEIIKQINENIANEKLNAD